jgi:hypothetical protein
MLERIIKVQGGEFRCSTCNIMQPAGTVAHTQFHVEIAEQKPADIHIGFMPNHEPKTVCIALRTAAAVSHIRSQGRHPVITRKECPACDERARLATLRRNCFV